MGNLTRDPQLRRTATGTAVSDLGLAVSEKYRNKAGEVVEATCFADVVVWGRQAETCQEYLAKGAPVMVEGRLQLDQWQAENGEKRSRLRVRADRVQFLGKPGKGRPAGSADARAAPEGVEAAEPAEEGDRDEKVPF